MTSTQMLDRLKDYFNAEAYSDELVSQLSDFIESIPEKDHERVYSRLVHYRKWRSPVLVDDLRDACEYLEVAYTKPKTAEKFQLTCEACETKYIFKEIVNDEEEAQGIFARCPNCGMRGSDQLLAHRSAELNHGKLPEWFEEDKRTSLRETMPGGHFVGGRYKKGDQVEWHDVSFKPKEIL